MSTTRECEHYLMHTSRKFTGRTDLVRNIIALLALGSVTLVVSCQKPQSVLHVISADSCDEPAVIGTIGTREYALSVFDRRSDQGCQSVIGTRDVGKDFPVTVDLKRGVVKVIVGPGVAVYKIDQVHEVNPE